MHGVKGTLVVEASITCDADSHEGTSLESPSGDNEVGIIPTKVPVHGYVDPTSGNIKMFNLNTDTKVESDTNLTTGYIGRDTSLTAIQLHGCEDRASGHINMNNSGFNSQLITSQVESGRVCDKT